MRGATTKKIATKSSKGKVVTNQVTLDPKNPIPFEYGGQAYSFINRERYIPFLFPQDNFFQTLLEARTLSVTQSACVETKRDFCTGRGLWDINGKTFSPEFAAWLPCVNARNESASKVNKKIFGSYFTYGNVPIEIVRMKVAGTPKLFIYAHNVREWRLGWPDSDGVVRKAIMSKLFLRQGIISQNLLENAITLPLYDPQMPNSKKNWIVDKNGAERTLIWMKNDMEGYDYYGMPESISSLIYQVLEYKSARYNMDNFDNNMVIAAILALKGNLGQEEANKIAKSIISAHTGDGKRGRVAVVASEEGIDASEFHQMETQNEGSYDKMDDKVMQKIIMANKWDATLAGIQHEKALGKGNTYLRTIYEIKKKTVIDPMKQELIDTLWFHVQTILKSWMGIDADAYELGIKDVDPISIIADVDPSPAIKVNEVRKALDLPADESAKGELYLGELVPPEPSIQVGQTDV